MAETRKAHDRRVREGWYQKFFKNPILDIGSGVDPLPFTGITRWDYQWTYDEVEGGIRWKNEPGDRDAQSLAGLEDESFNTVYASHILEHLPDPVEALRNWWRVLKPSGMLLIMVPHRDLYEKKLTHPSRWNPRDREGGGGHLTFWLPDVAEAPDTLSLIETIQKAIPACYVHEFRVVDDGYDYSLPVDVHPVGEFAIEIALQKPTPEQMEQIKNATQNQGG